MNIISMFTQLYSPRYTPADQGLQFSFKQNYTSFQGQGSFIHGHNIHISASYIKTFPNEFWQWI